MRTTWWAFPLLLVILISGPALAATEAVTPMPQLQAGQAAFEGGRWAEAVAAAQGVLAGNATPGEVARAEELLILSLLAQGDFQTTAQALEERMAAARQAGRSTAALAMLGTRLKDRQAAYEAATAGYRATIKSHRNSMEAVAAQLSLADTDLRYGRAQAAVDAYEALIRAHPNSAEAKRAQARLPLAYEALGAGERLAALSRQTIAKAPDGPAVVGAVETVAAGFLRSRAYEKGLAWLAGIAQGHPKTAAAQAALLARGRLRAEQEPAHPEAAAAEYLAAVTERPDSELAARAADAVAQAYAAVGSHEQGIAALATLAAQHPGTELAAWCGRLIGHQQKARGETVQAEAAYQKVIDTDPKSPQAAQAVGDIAALYGGAATYEKAVARLKALAAEHPGTAIEDAADRQLGYLCMTYGRPEEADEAYVRLLARNPKDAQLLVTRRNVSYTFMNLAVQEYMAKDWALAIRHLTRVLADDQVKEDWLLALRLLGQCYQAVGDHGQAETTYRRLVGMAAETKDIVDAQFQLGECLMAQREWEEAVKAYEQLAKRWPKDPMASFAADRIAACREMQQEFGTGAGAAPETETNTKTPSGSPAAQSKE